MYNIETVDVVILGLQSACFRHQSRTRVNTECPNSCNHSLTPIRLGLPFKLGVPFKLGMEPRPEILLPPGRPIKLDRAFRRLLFRSAIALCFMLDDGRVYLYRSSYGVEFFHLVNAVGLPTPTHSEWTIAC